MDEKVQFVEVRNPIVLGMQIGLGILIVSILVGFVIGIFLAMFG